MPLVPLDRRARSPISPDALGATADRILNDHVIPFWLQTVDYERGGYRLEHDRAGVWRGPSDKFLVTQARTLWFFARLAHQGLGSRDAAEAGYRFMRDHLWDRENGGFH